MKRKGNKEILTSWFEFKIFHTQKLKLFHYNKLKFIHFYNTIHNIVTNRMEKWKKMKKITTNVGFNQTDDGEVFPCLRQSF
jgi:hypothetical protein